MNAFAMRLQAPANATFVPVATIRTAFEKLLGDARKEFGTGGKFEIGAAHQALTAKALKEVASEQAKLEQTSTDKVKAEIKRQLPQLQEQGQQLLLQERWVGGCVEIFAQTCCS